MAKRRAVIQLTKDNGDDVKYSAVDLVDTAHISTEQEIRQRKYA